MHAFYHTSVDYVYWLSMYNQTRTNTIPWMKMTSGFGCKMDKSHPWLESLILCSSSHCLFLIEFVIMGAALARDVSRVFPCTTTDTTTTTTITVTSLSSIITISLLRPFSLPYFFLRAGLVGLQSMTCLRSTEEDPPWYRLVGRRSLPRWVVPPGDFTTRATINKERKRKKHRENIYFFHILFFSVHCKLGTMVWGIFFCLIQKIKSLQPKKLWKSVFLIG